MFHRVGREKRSVVGELVLGVCAKGIIVYEMKNHVRTVTRRFLWRETDSISTGVKNMAFQSDFAKLCKTLLCRGSIAMKLRGTK